MRLTSHGATFYCVLTGTPNRATEHLVDKACDFEHIPKRHPADCLDTLHFSTTAGTCLFSPDGVSNGASDSGVWAHYRVVDARTKDTPMASRLRQPILCLHTDVDVTGPPMSGELRR